MLAVTGLNTTVVQALAAATGERLYRIRCEPSMFDLGCQFIFETFFDEAKGALDPITGYVLAAGVIQGTPLWRQSREQVYESLAVNLGNTLRLADQILNIDPGARIVLLGSLSALTGSFDALYAACKAGVHAYVDFKELGPNQHLIAVAPPIISDSGMTRRRCDYPAVLEARRTVTASAVAEAIVGAWRDGKRRGVIWL